MSVKALAAKYKDEMIALRRWFHQHPELSLKEYNTSKRIKEELDKLDIPYETIGETGVLGTIKGGKEGKTILLRSDMDALEVTEKNDFEFKSVNDGVMHACGHDAHTAILIGAAKILKELQEEIPGTVKLCFQPAEELAQGAKMMIEEGHVLDGVDGAFGGHVWADVPVGQVDVTEGPRICLSFASPENPATVPCRTRHWTRWFAVPISSWRCRRSHRARSAPWSPLPLPWEPLTPARALISLPVKRS